MAETTLTRSGDFCFTKALVNGISKPKSMRAVIQHNLSWFNHFIWGDPLPDFTTPEVPKKETPEKKAAGD